MPTEHVTRLPDQVYGSADVAPLDNRRVKVSVTQNDDGSSVLLHAHVGGVYIAMSENNWRALFAALTELEIVEPPKVTHRITFNDADRTAHITTVVKA